MDALLVIFGIAALALYFLPTIVAYRGDPPRFGTILLINLFFGWSLLPWIFAMWMAFRSDPVRPIGAIPQAPRLAQAGNSASNNAALNGRRCNKCGRTSSPKDPFFYICGVCQHGGDGTITRSLQGAVVAGIQGGQDDKTVGPSEISPSDGALVARRTLARLGVTQTAGAGPVTLGRELLLRAWALVEERGSSQEARAAVIAACGAFMAGVAEPDGSEYGATDTYAVADALMWFGIASGLLVSPLERVPHLRDRPEAITEFSLGDPTVLSIAGDYFAHGNYLVNSARCDEELGEIFRLTMPNDSSLPSSFKGAAELFRQAGEQERAASALRRANGGPRLHSEFLTRRRWGSEAATTVAGSIEYQALQSAVMLPSPAPGTASPEHRQALQHVAESIDALIDKSTPSPQMTGSTASQLSTRSPATFTVVLTLSGVSFGPSTGGGIVSMHTRWSESPFDEWIHAGVSAAGGQPTLLKVQAAKQDYGGFGSVDDSKHQIAKWTKEFMEASRPSAWNPDQVVETTLTLEGASMKDFSGDRSVTFNGRPKRLGILLADLNFHQNAIELAIWQITSGRLT